MQDDDGFFDDGQGDYREHSGEAAPTMKKFNVAVAELHYTHWEVEAESAEQAKAIVAQDDGTADLIDTVFSNNLDVNLWLVAEVDSNE